MISKFDPCLSFVEFHLFPLKYLVKILTYFKDSQEVALFSWFSFSLDSSIFAWQMVYELKLVVTAQQFKAQQI